MPNRIASKEVALGVIKIILADLLAFSEEHPGKAATTLNYMTILVVTEYIHYWFSRLTV